MFQKETFWLIEVFIHKGFLYIKKMYEESSKIITAILIFSRQIIRILKNFYFLSNLIYIDYKEL